MKCHQVVKCRTRRNVLVILFLKLLIAGGIIFYMNRDENKVSISYPPKASISKAPDKESVANEKLHAFVDSLINTKSELFGNNETGSDQLIVPNFIHYVRFNKTEYSFVDYVCLKAAMRNHQPDQFYIHTDVGDSFTGKYWDWIRQDNELFSRIRIMKTDLPFQIYGQKLSKKWRFWHGSDIVRIQVLMQYGGIYLDNDVFVIKNLDKYRRYEAVVNWEKRFLGNQVIIAHKDARLLKAWLETYRHYRSDLWYYNGGQRPSIHILYQHPELVHRVKGQFGADTSVSAKLYKDKNFNWRNFDTIHLLINHRNYMDPHYKKTPKIFDEENIKTYQYPFGQMVRELFKYEKIQKV